MHNENYAKQNHPCIASYCDTSTASLQREVHWANVMLQALPATGPLSTPPPFLHWYWTKKEPGSLSCSQVPGPASVHRPTIRQLAYISDHKTKPLSKQQEALGISHVAALCSRMVGMGLSEGEQMQGGTWVKQSVSGLSTFTARINSGCIGNGRYVCIVIITI